MKGAKERLELHKPTVLIEVKPENAIEVFQIFQELGYEGYAIKNTRPISLVKISKELGYYMQGVDNYLYCYNYAIFNTLNQFIQKLHK